MESSGRFHRRLPDHRRPRNRSSRRTAVVRARRGHWILPREHVVNRPDGAGDEWIGIHCNGIHTYSMECIRNGMDWNPVHWIPLHTSRCHPWSGARPGREPRGAVCFHYNAGNETDHGGEKHGPMRCLRDGTGTARMRPLHGLRQDPLSDRRSGLLPPPQPGASPRSTWWYTNSPNPRRWAKVTGRISPALATRR